MTLIPVNIWKKKIMKQRTSRLGFFTSLFSRQRLDHLNLPCSCSSVQAACISFSMFWTSGLSGGMSRSRDSTSTDSALRPAAKSHLASVSRLWTPTSPRRLPRGVRQECKQSNCYKKKDTLERDRKSPDHLWHCRQHQNHWYSDSHITYAARQIADSTIICAFISGEPEGRASHIPTQYAMTRPN